jgi:hypothetical protein
MNLATEMSADARLMILRELAEQVDGRLYDKQLQRVLGMNLIRRTMDWVRTELRAMKELGVIKIIVVGEDDMWIAELLPLGQEHLDRLRIIEGIARPKSRP